MRTLVMRLAAVAALFALPVGTWMQCAGWQGTSEARMACCEREQECPMHSSPTDRTAAHTRVAQDQADACCAVSGSAPVSPSAASASVAMPLVLVSPAVPVLRVPTPALRDAWRDHVPIGVGAVPRHVLLAVFLV